MKFTKSQILKAIRKAEEGLTKGLKHDGAASYNLWRKDKFWRALNHKKKNK